MVNKLIFVVLLLCCCTSMSNEVYAQNLANSSSSIKSDNIRLGWNKSIRVRGLMQKFDPFNDIRIKSLNDSLSKYRKISDQIEEQDNPSQALIKKARNVTPHLSDSRFIKTETVSTTFWSRLRDKLEDQLKSANNTLKVYKVTSNNLKRGKSEGQPVYSGGEATTQYNMALKWLNDGLNVVKREGVERLVGNNRGLGNAEQANDAVLLRNLESIVAVSGNVFASNSDISVSDFSDLSMFEVKFEATLDETGFSYQPKLIIFGMTFYRTQQDVPNYSSVMLNEHYEEYTQSAIHALDKGVGIVLDLEDSETLEFLVTEGVEIGGQKVTMSFYDLIKNLHYRYDIKSENEMIVQEATRFGYQDIEKFKQNMLDNYNAIFLEQFYGQVPTWWVNADKGIVTNGLFNTRYSSDNN